eukprot:m.47475 g.47475  ORF g.47475 m.47475 type:complete len:521 (+) comp13228_c0_seq1:71-1633(+)
MPKRGKRKNKGAPADTSLIDHGRKEQRAFDDEDALEEDEIDAFHSSKDRVALDDYGVAGGSDDDDGEDHVMNLEDSSSEEGSDGNDDEDDEDELDDDINDDFLAALKPRRRKIAKDDIHGNDEDEDAQEMKRSLEGWGRDKAQFYDTNFVDADYGTDSEDERMAAAEEEEALLLQQQQAQALNDADFGLDEVAVAPKSKRKSKTKVSSTLAEVEEIPKDFESMSLTERTKYVKRARPELAALQQLCTQLQTEKNDLLDPLLHLLGNTTSVPVLRALGLPPGIQAYLRQRAALVATYAMTIASYLLLVAKDTPGLEDHPIGQAMLSMQQVIAQAEEAHSALLPRLEDALATMQDGEGLPASNANDQAAEEDDAMAVEPEIVVRKQQRKSKKSKASWRQADRNLELEDDGDSDEGATYLAQVKAAKQKKKQMAFEATLPNDDGRDDGADGTRSVSYKIMKNKGLLPSRKKEYRNPRVRGRNKFKRATKRRKGQTVEAVKEIPRYSGEATGIKRTVTKSTKLS